MLIAQKHSAVEQKCQADQYNKRTKWCIPSVGNSVLMANKGVRGKCKLADKWESMLYTVVASNPALHIYRTRDRDGNKRVVHHNLLFQANFVPLPECQPG